VGAFHFRLASLSEVCEENMDTFHHFTSTEVDEEVLNDFAEKKHSVIQFMLLKPNYMFLR